MRRTKYKGDTETRSNRRNQGRHKKKKVASNIFKTVLILMLLAIIGGIAFGAKMLLEAEETWDMAYRPRKNSADMNEKIEPQKTPFSVLVLGVDDNDERELGSNRTDTMIVATVNPTTGKVTMVSIPRDTFTYIESDNFTGYAKINSAYTHDEADGSIKAVENLLDIKVNFYVTVDFQAFEKIVDSLGGININVPVAISEANADVTKMIELDPGSQTLTGEEALAFARTRKIDDDIKRGERQQMVVQSVLKKAMSVGSITKYSDVLASLNNHLWTDMNKDTMMKIAQSGLTSDYSFETYTFSWMSFDYSYTGENMVGLHKDSVEYIEHKLKVALGEETEDERDEKGYKFETDGVVSERTYPPYGDGAVDNL